MCVRAFRTVCVCAFARETRACALSYVHNIATPRRRLCGYADTRVYVRHVRPPNVIKMLCWERWWRGRTRAECIAVTSSTVQFCEHAFSRVRVCLGIGPGNRACAEHCRGTDDENV